MIRDGWGQVAHLINTINRKHHDFFVAAVGPKRARNLEYAIAGSLMGIGEVILLPLDTLKIISVSMSPP